MCHYEVVKRELRQVVRFNKCLRKGFIFVLDSTSNVSTIPEGQILSVFVDVSSASSVRMIKLN